MQRSLPVSLLSLALLGTGCCGEARQTSVASAARKGDREPVREAKSRERTGQVLHGEASYYADYFNGRKTANGERYDPRKLTAANRTLPFGTRVRITRLDTGRSVVVRVNDRGPFGKRKRIFDLSKQAARELDMLHAGRADIEAVVLLD
jgi:rare lipoprotein A